MYARLTTFPLRPGSRGEAEQRIGRFRQVIAERSGYRSATFFFTEAGDELGSFSVWDSREQAEAVTSNVRAAAEEALSGTLNGAATTQILEVFHDSRALGMVQIGAKQLDSLAADSCKK